jgi:iron complex outermembrane receptor protein
MKENLYRKNSINNFSRVITVPDYHLMEFKPVHFLNLLMQTMVRYHSGLQEQIYTLMSSKKTILVLFPLRDYNQITAHLFKIRLKANDWLDIETGLRGDYVHEYGFSILPKSALF